MIDQLIFENAIAIAVCIPLTIILFRWASMEWCLYKYRKMKRNDDEPKPPVTPQSLKSAGKEWGRNFETSAIQREPEPLKTGGLPGLREEREAILRAMRLVRAEIHELRKAGPTAAEGRTELDYALAEYQDYDRRRRDVDKMMEANG